MKHCPFCNAEIVDSALATGRCPSCGMNLQETVRIRRDETSDPSGTDTFDSDDDGFAPYESDSAAAQDASPRTVDSTDTFGGDEAEEYAPVEESVRDTDTADEIRSLWGDALSEDSNPEARIKPAVDIPVARTHITLKEKDLAQPGALAPGADFELLSLLGEGGMGSVYEARQTSVDRTIAVKVIKPHLAVNPKQRDKFLAEAAVTGELDHPNIVPVHDLGQDKEGTLYYAMKRVRGTPWSDVLPTLPAERNLEILMRVADAVAFAHAKGVIHRDIKPQNVMLGEFGEVLLMDWGLAAAVNDEAKAPPLTRATAAGGTPAYMAPEMALADVKRIGVGSDVYLLGAVLFEIVTGKRPHAGDKVLQCLLNAGTNTIEPAPQGGELLDIAMKAMATEPEDRYPTVKDFQQAVRDYQSHAESVHLCHQAGQNLQAARQSGEYEDYARAVFGMHEALALWDGNAMAKAGLATARFFYAECAFERGDLDLAQSLLDPEVRRHAVLLEKVDEALAGRIARQRRLKIFTAAAVGLVIAIIVILSVASVLISRARDKALAAQAEEAKQRRVAETEKEKALAAKAAEEEQRRLAESQRRIAEEQKEKAQAARLAEEEQRKVAESAREVAEAASRQARAAETRAVDALEAMIRAQTREEEAKAKAKAAQVMAAEAQDELSRTGMLLDNTWWTFPAEEARTRQSKAATEAGLEVERTVAVNGADLVLRLIPPGEFVMGSPPEEQKRAGVEYLHRVRIDYPFYIGRTELTESQWAAALGEAPLCARGRDPDPTLPVNEVSWLDVRDSLLPALNRRAPRGYVFDLPTEAEWEYACRAGTATAYSAGATEEALAASGYYLFNSERRVQSVAGLAPNAWGLFDMHGNVSEWCRDVYDPAWYLKGPAVNPLREGESERRVNRGGGCLNLPHHCRSAYRSWAHHANRYKFLGLRIVLRPKGKIAADDSQ